MFYRFEAIRFIERSFEFYKLNYVNLAKQKESFDQRKIIL